MDNTIHLTPIDAHSWVVVVASVPFDTLPEVELQALPLVVECHRSSVGPSVASSVGPSVASSVDPSVALQVDPSVALQVDPSVALQAGPSAGP